MEENVHTYPNTTGERRLGRQGAFMCLGARYLEKNVQLTIAEQTNDWSLKERVRTENTDRVVVAVLQPLQVGLNDTLHRIDDTSTNINLCAVGMPS